MGALVGITEGESGVVERRCGGADDKRRITPPACCPGR
jgi:hypothetical protein